MFNQNNVERIRKAFENISKCKWEAGDAALDEVPLAQQAGNEDVGVHVYLKELAVSADVSYEALSAYRKVSASWAPEDRISSVAWSVHREVMGEANRRQIIEAVKTEHGKVTVDLVRKALGKAQTNTGKMAEALTPEQVAEIIRANQDTAVETMAAIRMENAERQIELNAQLREASAQDFDDQDVVYHPPVVQQPAPAPTQTQPTVYIHNYSETSKKLVALSVEADDLVNAMAAEGDGIFYADLSNPENYKVIEAAYDSLSLNVTRIGQMLADMREQAINR